MATTAVGVSDTSVSLPTFTLGSSDTPVAAQTLAFGQAFLPGAVPAGAGLAMVIDGVTTPVQMEVRTRYSDGSVEFAQLIVPQPALAASQTLTAALALAPTPTAPAIDLAAALGSHTATVNLTFADGTAFNLDIIAAARQAFANGTVSYWQQGPYATQARFDVPVSGSLHLTFDLTASADGNFSIDTHFNNDLAMGAVGGAVTYSTELALDGATTTVPSLTQAQYQNWSKLLETRPTSFVNVQQDLDYLQRTGLLQNYDPTRNAAAKADITAIPGQLADPSWNAPLAANGIYQGMPTTGSRPDIGPTTGANADWLLTQDPLAAQFALDQAGAAASIPWHFQDVATGDWLSIANHPMLWTDPRGGTGDPGGLTQQVDPNTGWDVDTAHAPDNSYIPYLLTGDRSFLDELNAEASADIVGTWNGPRANGLGLVANVNQIRGAAWSLRTIQEAAQMNPDGSTDKAYFTQIADNNWQWIVTQIPTWTAQQGEAYGHIPNDWPTDTQFAPWQLDYFATTAAQAAIDGNNDAKTFLAWSTNFLAGRFFQADQGYDPRTGVTYWQPTVDSAGNPITTWAGLQAAAVQSGSAGNWWPEVPFAEVALASLASTMSALGDSKEGLYAMKAYGWLVASGAPGLTNDAQFQISPRLTDGNLLQWSNITLSNSAAGTTATFTGPDAQADQLLHAGAGDDTLTGGTGTNLLFAGTGHDTLVGSGIRNYLFGGSGNTLFRPGNGINYLDVGSDASSQSARGVDTVALSLTDTAQDTIADFDPRFDTFTLAGATNADVTRALTTATPTADGGTTLTLSPTLTLTLQGITPTQLTPASFVLTSTSSAPPAAGQAIYKVGANEQYQTINAAITAMNASGKGGDIQVDAGTYVNDGGYIANPSGPVTIEGVGGMAIIQDPSYYAGGKAAIVTEGTITLKNLDISGVTVPDGNGAGVRYDSGDLTLDNVSLHGNQDGILGGYSSPGQGTITIENSDIYGNGTSAGNTHNIYIGDIQQFTLTDSYIHDANVGHEVKSRAQNTTITDSIIADNQGTSSYSIDLPNGGNATITGNTIEQGPNGANGTIIAYDEEGISNTPNGQAYAGTNVSVSGNTILNDMTAHDPTLVWNASSSATVALSNNQLYGVNAAQVSGAVTATGDTTPTQGGTYGTGPDTLTVTLAEDAWKGNAQANVTIDGTLLTATPLTVTALHATGASEAFTFKGTFGAGPHAVGVSFLNDAYGGSPALDRNLYVDGLTLDGYASSNLAHGAAAMNWTMTNQFGISAGAPAPVPDPKDTLMLHVSEDAWRGDAEFTIQVDGRTIGNPLVAFASHAAGESQTYLLQGDFGAGPHQVGVTFLNDAWGGTPATDRNLYLDGVDFDGKTFLNQTAALQSNGSKSITVNASAPGIGTQHLFNSPQPDILLALH